MDREGISVDSDGRPGRRGTVAVVRAAAGFPRRAGAARAVTRLRFHDHALVLDHGTEGA